MQQREINRDEMIEHKKRIEKHKNVIENDIKKITQHKAANSDNMKKKAVKKRKIDKKAMKERQRAVAEKAMEDARTKTYTESHIEYEREEPVVITKEERAERFKRLHAMVQEMMKKNNE